MQKPAIHKTMYAIIAFLILIPAGIAYTVDSFNDATINTTLWNETDPTGVISESAGNLQVAIGTTLANYCDSNLISQIPFSNQGSTVIVSANFSVNVNSKFLFLMSNYSSLQTGGSVYTGNPALYVANGQTTVYHGVFPYYILNHSDITDDVNYTIIYNGSDSYKVYFSNLTTKNDHLVTVSDRPNSNMLWPAFCAYRNEVLFNQIFINTSPSTFTIYDEDTRKIIDDRTVTIEAISDTGTLTYSSTTGIIKVPFTISTTDTNYVLKAYATGYNTTFRYITISGVEVLNENITLINITNSEHIILIVYDENGDTVPGARVQVMRYNLTRNAYDLTQDLITNEEGAAYTNIQQGEEYYKFSVIYDGETKLTTAGQYIYDDTIYLRITKQTANIENWNTIRGITYTLFYNTTSSNIHYTFIDATSTATGGCLFLYQYDNGGKNLINTSCSVGSSGTCLIPIYSQNGTYYVGEARINLTNTWYLLDTITKSYIGEVDFGNEGLVYLILAELVIPFIGIWNPAVMILTIPVPFFLLSYMNMIPGTFKMVGMALLIVGIVIVFVMRGKT